MSDKPKAIQKRPRKPKPRGLRDVANYVEERPLTFLFRDRRKKDLGDLVKPYLKGESTYQELLDNIPLETRWLRGSEKQKERVRGEEVLLVKGWCPNKDEETDLDANPLEVSYTIRWIMGIEKALGKKVLFLDFFPDCQRNKEDRRCDGHIDRVQENVIHSIAMRVEIEVARREYGITFCGVWGFAKLFLQEIDDAVWGGLEWATEIPRSYLQFHVSKVVDTNLEKRGLTARDVVRTLIPVSRGQTEKELYSKFEAWFNSHVEMAVDIETRKAMELRRLPPWEVQRVGKVAKYVQCILADSTSESEEEVVVVAENSRKGKTRKSDVLPKSGPIEWKPWQAEAGRFEFYPKDEMPIGPQQPPVWWSAPPSPPAKIQELQILYEDEELYPEERGFTDQESADVQFLNAREARLRENAEFCIPY